MDNLALKEALNLNKLKPENNINEMVNAHSQLANTINSMENRCQNLELKLKESQV